MASSLNDLVRAWRERANYAKSQKGVLHHQIKMLSPYALEYALKSNEQNQMATAESIWIAAAQELEAALKRQDG